MSDYKPPTILGQCSRCERIDQSNLDGQCGNWPCSILPEQPVLMVPKIACAWVRTSQGDWECCWCNAWTTGSVYAPIRVCDDPCDMCAMYQKPGFMLGGLEWIRCSQCNPKTQQKRGMQK